MRSVIVKEKEESEGYQERIERMKQSSLRPKTLEQLFGNERAREMRRDAVIKAQIDRRKFGDDY
jgi:hypothetical protein